MARWDCCMGDQGPSHQATFRATVANSMLSASLRITYANEEMYVLQMFLTVLALVHVERMFLLHSHINDTVHVGVVEV